MKIFLFLKFGERRRGHVKSSAVVRKLKSRWIFVMDQLTELTVGALKIPGINNKWTRVGS